ncbi:MAG: DNA polymerase III subunit gamma/tau [Patescibacteria group bacterium]
MPNLSRAYRPQIFADVYGQENITETLRKEVEMNKLGHAYLFSGPRGVGKTTAARIFAKAVNCLAPQKGEPCMKCAACEKAAAGSIDIIEMDAASNTGVDNVREAIVEHVRFVPSELKYKVYIIDEAHMLSTSAWNALLKTIEEPPEHAIFIFATTEKHKVPATIVSRCQRCDFKRIASDRIITRLEDLAAKEKFKVDQAVYHSIAAKAEGCLRDAENLLGQLFSLGEKHVTSDVASLVIPPSQLPLAVALLTLAAKRDVPSVLQKILDLEQDGVSFMPLFDDLIAAIRSLMLAAVANQRDSLQKGDEASQGLYQLIGSFDHKELVNISLLLMERRKDAKQGLDSRFALEMAMTAIAIGATSENNQKPATNVQTPQPKDDPPLAIKPNNPSFNSQKPNLSENTKKQETNIRQTPSSFDSSPVTDQVSLSLNQVRLMWPKALEALENNKSLLFILKLCKPIDIQGQSLALHFQYPYHRQTIIDNPKNKMIVEDALRKILGFEALTIKESTTEVQADEKPEVKLDTVSKLLDAFGGQVVA